MPQVTLYLDEETDAKARAAAAAAGVSYSRWVAEIIRSRTRDQWPEQIRALAGSVRDFPRREEHGTHAMEPGDSARVPLDD
jgi:hypothetical protein